MLYKLKLYFYAPLAPFYCDAANYILTKNYLLMKRKRTLTLRINCVKKPEEAAYWPVELTVDIDLEYLVERLCKSLQRGQEKHHNPEGHSSQQGIVAFAKTRNSLFEKWVGHSRSRSSMTKYRVVTTHIQAFIARRFQKEDYPVTAIDGAFVRDFCDYLQTEKRLSDGTVRLYLVALKYFTNTARKQGLLPTDPFDTVQLPRPSRCNSSLSSQELAAIANLQLKGMRRTVRDFFLFSCYTGLAYADIGRLKPEHIERNGTEGWLTKTREKNGLRSVVRLLPATLQLLDRLPRCNRAAEGASGKWLDIPDNRTCNRHLTALSGLAGLHFRLHFHLARHTFATLLLTAGVPIETVSLMLGHSRITTTQIYAQVTRNKITRDTAMMSGAFPPVKV